MPTAAAAAVVTGRQFVLAATAIGGLFANVLLTPLAAQDVVRTAITVDYVGVEGVYLPIGAENGWAPNDTVTVFASESTGAPLGRIELTSVTRRRSVGTMLAPVFALERGDVVYAALPVATDEPVAEPAMLAAAPEPEAPTGAVTPTRRSVAERRPRVSGRMALDVEARETRTSWEGDLFGETRRRFATPVMRLSLMASDLGAGFSIRTNLRASYRYSDVTLGVPNTAIRAYELGVINDFGSRPLELRMGRFHNPYESYSAYWDGVLLRVGGSRGGVGIVAGFEPSRYNEGFSTDIRKATGFADVRLSGLGWRYDSDVSVHLLRTDSMSNRTSAGWSQRLRLGPVSFSQRLRVDRSTDAASWALEQLRLRGTAEVFGPLRMQVGYSRRQPSSFVQGAALAGNLREEFSVGGSFMRPRGAVSADLGVTRRSDEPDGRSIAVAANLLSGGVLLLASGRYWQHSDQRTLGFSPGMAFGFGPVDLRVGYQLYRTESAVRALMSHAGDLRMTMTLPSELRLTLRGQQQWGSNFSGTRIQLGLWRSF